MDHSPASASATPAAPAVIFDLDGTLVDTEPLYYEAGRRLLAAHGVPGFSWREHQRFIGISTRETLAALRRTHALTAPVDRLLAEKNRRYLSLARESAEVFPRMRHLADLLHTAGCPLAVASGSSRESIDAVLEGTGLAPLFPVRVSADEVAQGKPAPAVLLEAARQLGVEPSGCVVVEDAPPGAEAARRAGMRCVAVPYVPSSAGDPGFASVGLLYAGGQEELDVGRTYRWITGTPAP